MLSGREIPAPLIIWFMYLVPPSFTNIPKTWALNTFSMVMHKTMYNYALLHMVK